MRIAEKFSGDWKKREGAGSQKSKVRSLPS
jgi:hypothetical protein